MQMAGWIPPAKATTLPDSVPSPRYSCLPAARTSYFPVNGIAEGFILPSKRLANRLRLEPQSWAKTQCDIGNPRRAMCPKRKRSQKR